MNIKIRLSRDVVRAVCVCGGGGGGAKSVNNAESYTYL